MTNLPVPVSDIDRKMRLIARELAVDIMEPQTILEKFDI
jgi:hypothetical protein